MGEIAETFEKYPDVGVLLPAMGYGQAQMDDLAQTINATDCDLVLVGTPIDLARVVEIKKPNMRVTYDLAEKGPAFADAILQAVRNHPSQQG